MRVEKEGAQSLYANTQHGCERQISSAKWKYGTFEHRPRERERQRETDRQRETETETERERERERLTQQGEGRYSDVERARCPC